jgi:hypothetical protein
LLDRNLILLDGSLELLHPLCEHERFSLVIGMLRLQSCQAQCRSKGLIHLVIGQPFGIAGVLALLGSYGHCRKFLGGLPWAYINERLWRAANAARAAAASQECETRHSAARSP